MKSDHERARRASLSIRLRCVRRSGVTHRRRGGLDIGNSSEAEAEAHGATESLNRRGTYHDAMRLGLLWRSVMPGSSDSRKQRVLNIRISHGPRPTSKGCYQMSHARQTWLAQGKFTCLVGRVSDVNFPFCKSSILRGAIFSYDRVHTVYFVVGNGPARKHHGP
jgi:hypothetical protein